MDIECFDDCVQLKQNKLAELDEKCNKLEIKYNNLDTKCNKLKLLYNELNTKHAELVVKYNQILMESQTK